jgi:hypothetical protein
MTARDSKPLPRRRSHRGLSVLGLLRLHRDIAERPRRDQPRRKTPAPAQEPEAGDQPAGTRQAGLFDKEERR